MSKTRIFGKYSRPELLDELRAAGFAPTLGNEGRPRLQNTADKTYVEIADGEDETRIAAVVNAHNPAVYDAEDAAQVTKFDQAVAFLKTFYTTPNAQLTADQMKNAIKALSVVARKHDQALALDDG